MRRKETSELNYRIHQPNNNLKSVLQAVWILDCDEPGRNFEFPVLPDGCVELVHDLGQNRPILASQDRIMRLPKVAYFGLFTKPLVMKLRSPFRIVGLRFVAGFAGGFFDERMDEVRNCVVDSSNLAGTTNLKQLSGLGLPEATELIQRTWSSSIEQLNENPAVLLSRKFQEANGMESVSTIIRQSGFSERSARRWFNKFVGVSPDVLNRILRFRTALRCLRETSDPLVNVAIQSGYFDQSHMTREFKRFSGMAPRSLVSTTNQFLATL